MRSPPIEAAGAFQLSLDAGGRSGAANMAIDAELLDRAAGTGASFLRLYRFDPPCLSLGRNEPAARYDHTEIARRGLDVVRRPPRPGRVARARGDLRGGRPVAAFGFLAERVPRHPYTDRRGAPVPRCRCHSGAPTDLHSPEGRPAHVLLRDSGRRRGTRRWSQASARHRSGREAHSCSMGRFLLDGSQEIVRVVSHQASAVSGETTLSARAATTREFRRGRGRDRRRVGRRSHLPQPPPTSSNLHNLAFGPGADRSREILGPCQPPAEPAA